MCVRLEKRDSDRGREAETRGLRSYVPLCVILKMMCLLKLAFDQNSIIINHKINSDFNSDHILKVTLTLLEIENNFIHCSLCSNNYVA